MVWTELLIAYIGGVVAGVASVVAVAFIWADDE